MAVKPVVQEPLVLVSCRAGRESVRMCQILGLAS